MEDYTSPPGPSSPSPVPARTSFKVLLKGDFPGGPAVKNPLCNAGDMSSIPGRGTKIPHATGQLSPHMAKIPCAATKTQRSTTPTTPTHTHTHTQPLIRVLTASGNQLSYNPKPQHEQRESTSPSCGSQ